MSNEVGDLQVVNTKFVDGERRRTRYIPMKRLICSPNNCINRVSFCREPSRAFEEMSIM